MKIKITNPESRVAHYIGVNILNEAQQIGYNVGINAAKKAVYGAVVRQNSQDEWDWESRLSMGGDRTSSLSPVGVLENELILQTEDGTEISFLDAKINVTKSKTIKSQTLVGITGSVKEYVQEDDYSVKITGNIYIDDPFHFPVENMKLLNDILTKVESLSVASVYLNKIFDVHRLVFTSGNFHQGTMKYFNVFPVDIDFKSDIDHSFLVEDNV